MVSPPEYPTVERPMSAIRWDGMPAAPLCVLQRRRMLKRTTPTHPPTHPSLSPELHGHPPLARQPLFGRREGAAPQMPGRALRQRARHTSGTDAHGIDAHGTDECYREPSLEQPRAAGGRQAGGALPARHGRGDRGQPACAQLDAAAAAGSAPCSNSTTFHPPMLTATAKCYTRRCAAGPHQRLPSLDFVHYQCLLRGREHAPVQLQPLHHIDCGRGVGGGGGGGEGQGEGQGGRG